MLMYLVSSEILSKTEHNAFGFGTPIYMEY